MGVHAFPCLYYTGIYNQHKQYPTMTWAKHQYTKRQPPERLDTWAPSRTPGGPFLLHCVEWMLVPFYYFISFGVLLRRSLDWRTDVQNTPEVLHPPYDPNIGRAALLGVIIVRSALN